MRMVLTLGTIAFASSVMVACGKPESPVSSLKSGGFSCDLKSSAAASNDASRRAFQCAYNSLKSAGKLAGGGLVTDIANVVDGVKNVYEGSAAAAEVFNDLNEFINNGGRQPIDLEDSQGDLQQTFDSGKAIFEQTEVGEKIKRKAMYGCLNGNYNAVKDLVSLVGMSSDLGGGQSASSTLTVSDIQTLGSLGYTSIKALLDRMNTLSQCSQWLSGARTRGLVKLSSGIQKITTSLEVVTTLGRCGVDLAYGGYVLANNSACLVEDIKNYYQTLEREELAKNKYINDPSGGFEPLSEEDGRVEGNDGSYSRCSVIYGMWLADQTYYSYFTRSSVCADQCASSKGRQTYYENLRNIFPRSDDYGYCSMNQKIPGSQIQAEACISYCCSGEGSCVRAANRKAGYY